MPCETADFLADDPGVLVEASLSCPRCLAATVAEKIEAHGYDPFVVCVCDRCGHVRTVFLTPVQALRLTLAEPIDTAAAAWGGGPAI